jgi:hypothetical protein
LKPHGELALQYVRLWPETPTRTLASKIYNEHPEHFLTPEHARSTIRYYRGQKGDENRGKLADKTIIVKGKIDPFKLPRSYAKRRTPVELTGNKFLMLYDPHIPYHANEPLEIAIAEGVRQGCDAVFLGGDIMDCHLISNFIKEPSARKFGQELSATKSFLAYLREKFKTAEIHFKEGNHEERLWKYMRVKAPELLDVKAISMQELLGLDGLGIRWVHGRTKARIGKLSVFHGHEFGKTVFSPVNVARGLYLRSKASSICGHSHQTSEHTERDVNDKIVTCWSVGCLSELSPEYSPYNKWNHGFAIVERSGQSFHVQNFRVYNGSLL